MASPRKPPSPFHRVPSSPHHSYGPAPPEFFYGKSIFKSDPRAFFNGFNKESFSTACRGLNSSHLEKMVFQLL